MLLHGHTRAFSTRRNLRTLAHFPFHQALCRVFLLLPLTDASTSLEKHPIHKPFLTLSSLLCYSDTSAGSSTGQHGLKLSRPFASLSVLVPTFLLFQPYFTNNVKKLRWLHTESISTSFAAFFPGDLQEITSLCWRKQLSPISYQLAHHQPSNGEFTPEMPLSQQTNLSCTQTQKGMSIISANLTYP